MAGGEDDFEKARDAFRKAALATSIVTMRMYAMQGLMALERADALSAIVELPSRVPLRANHEN